MEQDNIHAIDPTQLNYSPYEPNPPDEPLWTITGVTDVPGFNTNSGLPVPMKRIDFRLWDGDEGFMEIPAKDFNADKVQQLVHTEAQKILSVKHLQGPPKSAFYGYTPQSQP